MTSGEGWGQYLRQLQSQYDSGSEKIGGRWGWLAEVRGKSLAVAEPNLIALKIGYKINFKLN